MGIYKNYSEMFEELLKRRGSRVPSA